MKLVSQLNCGLFILKFHLQANEKVYLFSKACRKFTEPSQTCSSNTFVPKYCLHIVFAFTQHIHRESGHLGPRKRHRIQLLAYSTSIKESKSRTCHTIAHFQSRFLPLINLWKIKTNP